MKMFLIKIIRRCFLLFTSLKINFKIKKKTIIHLMFNSPLNCDVVKFFNKLEDEYSHIFLCKKWFEQYSFPQGNNVYKINLYKYINFSKCKKIICHSFFDSEIINILYNNKKLLNKAYWVVWGGDLYEAKDEYKELFVKQNIHSIITLWDTDVVKSKYGNTQKYFSAMVPSVTNEEELVVNLNKKKNNDVIVIQINNSAHRSTIDVLKKLEHYKNENIKVRTVLSYGDMEWRESIKQTGKAMFGDKFEYLDKYISRKEYTEYLNENDIFILYQDRQQGLGNLLTSLRLGKKVYLKSDISPFNVLSKRGIKVYDAYNIGDIDFNEFKRNDYASESSKKTVSMLLDETVIRNDWNIIFED